MFFASHFFGAYIGNVFSGCIMYADDIALISVNCRGISKMVEICEAYGRIWDIQFNPQLLTIESKNPDNCNLTISNKNHTMVCQRQISWYYCT